MNAITMQKTIDAIVRRSVEVRWDAKGDGLALVRRRDGYVLVSEPAPGDEVLGERLVMACADGQPMPHGHALTPRERERAVRDILGV